MFGQEPRLPIDFLLGRDPQLREGSVHDWVLEHQTRLQVAFAGARERLQVMADRRKAHYDQHVRDEPLVEGQLVYLRNYVSRGNCSLEQWACRKVGACQKVGGVPKGFSLVKRNLGGVPKGFVKRNVGGVSKGFAKAGCSALRQ